MTPLRRKMTEDLKLRGPGALLGRQQHGWLRFRIADLLRNQACLTAAREEANTLVRRDPSLQGPTLSALRSRLGQFRKRIG